MDLICTFESINCSVGHNITIESGRARSGDVRTCTTTHMFDIRSSLDLQSSGCIIWMYIFAGYVFTSSGWRQCMKTFFFRQGQHGHLPCSCCLQESDVSCRQGFHVYLHGFLCSGDLGSVIYEVPYVDSSW